MYGVTFLRIYRNTFNFLIDIGQVMLANKRLEFMSSSSQIDEDLQKKMEQLREQYPQYFCAAKQEALAQEDRQLKDSNVFIVFRQQTKRKIKNKMSLNLKLKTRLFVHAQSISLQYPFSFSKKGQFQSLTQRQWYYLDADYVIQGPYSSLEMDTWHSKHYFNQEMMLTFRSLEINQFLKLNELYLQRFQFDDSIKASVRHHSLDHVQIKRKVVPNKPKRTKNLPFLSLNALNDFYRSNQHKQLLSYEFLSFTLQSPYINGSV